MHGPETRGAVKALLRQPRATIRSVAKKLKLSWSYVKNVSSAKEQRKRRARKSSLSVKMRRAKVSQFAKQRRVCNGKSFPLYPTARSIVKKLEQQHIFVSVKTVQRDLRAAGFRSRVRRFVPTRDPKVLQRRLTWAKDTLKALQRKDPDPDGVVFSDEHFVSCNENEERTMWVKSPDDLCPRERKRLGNTPHFMIWGAIGVGFRHLVVLPLRGEEGAFRLDADGYIRRCLSPIAQTLAKRGKCFQQDNARCHIAGRVKQYLARKRIRLIDWAPYSPDCNPIEQAWRLLDIEIAKMHCQTSEELLRAIPKAWAAIPAEKLDNLCRSFLSKLRATIARKGSA